MTSGSSSSAQMLSIGCLLLLLLGIAVVPTTESFPVNVVRRGGDGRLLYHHVTGRRPDNDAVATHDVVGNNEHRRFPSSVSSLALRPSVDKRRGGAAAGPLKMLVVGEAVLAAVFAAGAAVGSGLANLFADDDDHDDGDDREGGDKEKDHEADDSEVEREVMEEEGEVVRMEVGGAVPSTADLDVVAAKDGGEGATVGEEEIPSLVDDAEDASSRRKGTVEVLAEVEAEVETSSEDTHLVAVEEASEILGNDILHQIMSEEEEEQVLLPAHPPPLAETVNVKPTTPPRTMTTTTVMDPPTPIPPGIKSGISVSGYEEEDDDYSSYAMDPSLSDLCYLSDGDSSCPDTGPGLSGGDTFGGGGGGGGIGISSDGSDDGHRVNGGGGGSSRGHLFVNEPDLIAPVSTSSSKFGIQRRDANGATKVAPARTDNNGEEEGEGGVNGSLTTAAPRPRAAQRKEANGSMTSPSSTRIVPNGAQTASAGAGFTEDDIITAGDDATSRPDDDERRTGEVLSEGEGEEEEEAGIASSSSKSVTEEVPPLAATATTTPERAVIEDTAHRWKEKGATSFDWKGANDGSVVVMGGMAVEADDKKDLTSPYDGDGGSNEDEDASVGRKVVVPAAGVVDYGEAGTTTRRRERGPSGGITDAERSAVKTSEEEPSAAAGKGEVVRMMESSKVVVASNGSTKGGKGVTSFFASEGMGGPPHDSSAVVGRKVRSASSTISNGDDGSSSSSSSSSTAADKAKKEGVVTSATDGGGLHPRPAEDGVVVSYASSRKKEAPSTTTAAAKTKNSSTPDAEEDEDEAVAVASKEDPSSVTVKGSTASTAAALKQGGAVNNSTKVASAAGEAKGGLSEAGKVEGKKVASVGVKTKASTSEEGAPASGKFQDEEEVPSVGVAKTKATTAAPGEEGGRRSTAASSVKAKKEPSALDKVEEGAEPPNEETSARISVGEAPDAAVASSSYSGAGKRRPVVVSMDAPATADANEKKVSIASSEGEVGTSTTKPVEEDVAAASAETDSVGSRREEDSTSTASSRRNSTAVTAKREEGGVDAAKGGSPSKAEKKGGSKKKKRKKKRPAAAVERGEMQASSEEEEGPIADIMRGEEFNGPAGKDPGGASKDHPSVTNGEKIAATTVKEELVGSGKEDLSRTSEAQVSFIDDKEDVVESTKAGLLGSSKNEVSPTTTEEEDDSASKVDAFAGNEGGASITTDVDVGSSTEAASTDAEEIASVSVEVRDDSMRRKEGPSTTTEEDASTADKSGKGAPSAHAGTAAPTAAKAKSGCILKEQESNPMKEGVSTGADGKEVSAESSREEEAGAVGEDLPAISNGARPWKKTSPTDREQVSTSKEDPSARMRGKPASGAAKLVVSTDDLLATIGRKVAAAAKEDDVRSSKDEAFATKEGGDSAALMEDEVVSPPMEAPFDGPDQRSWDDEAKEEEALVRAYEKEEPLAAIEEVETAGREEAGPVKEFHHAEECWNDRYTTAEKKEVDSFFKDDPPLTKEPVAATDNEETDEALSAGMKIGPVAATKNEELDDSKEAQSAPTTEEVAMSAEEIKAIEAEIAELKGTLKSKRLEASRLEHEADDFSEAGYLRKRGETNDALKRMGVASASDKYLARTLVMREFLPVFDDMDALVDSPLVKGDSAKHYAIPALLFGLKAKLADLDVTEYGMSHDEADIVGGKIDVRRFTIVGEEFSNEVPNGSVLRVVRSGLEIKGNVVRLAECVISRGAEDLPFVAPATPTVVPHVTKPTSMGTRISANSASIEPLSPFEQRMRSWHGQEFDNQSSEDPGSGAKPFASASALGKSSDSGSGPDSKPSLHIWSGTSGSGGSGSGLGGSSDSNLSGSASFSKPSDASSSSGPHSSLLSSSSISSPPDSLQQSSVTFSSIHSGNSDLAGSSSQAGQSGSDSYSESPLHSRSSFSVSGGSRSGLGGSSDSVSSSKISKSESPHAPLSDDSGVSWAKLGLDGSSHSLLSRSGPQSNPSLLSSGGRGGSTAAFGGSSDSTSRGKSSDSNASIHSFSGYPGSNGPSSGSILGSSVVQTSSSPRSKTFDHSSHIHSGSSMSSWGPRKTSAPEASDSGSHPAPSRHSGSPEGVSTSVLPVTTPSVGPVTKPTTFVTPSYASRNITEPLSTFDLRMRRWHDVKSRVPGGRSKPSASGSGLDGSSSLSSLRSPARTKSSQRSSSDHSRSGESISGVNGSPSSASPGPSSPSQTTLQPTARHPRSSRPSRKEEVGSSGSNPNEELVSSSSDSQTTLSRNKSSNSKVASLSTGPVGSTSSRPGSPRESSVQSPSVHSSTSSSTESSFSGSKTKLFRHSSPGNSESDRFDAPALSSNHPEEVLPPEPPVTPPEASLTTSTEPTSGGSYLDALSGHTDSVEPASFGRSTSSKHESNSARESGYLSGLARETTPATSPSPTYSTPRRTNLFSGGSYLEALSGPTGLGADETTRTPSFSRDGCSNPVASVPARRSNDLAGSKTKEFRQSSGFPDRRSSVDPASRLSHPGEVQLSEPTEALPVTSPTPDGNPVSTCSYLDALSGPGDDSVEPTQYRHGKISKQASKSSRESGYSSQLAQGTPPATSLTPTHSTSRSTRPVSRDSYLDALSSLGASNPGDAVESASFGPDGDAKPAVASPAQGSNDLESRGSDSRAPLFHQSSSGLSERSTYSAAALNSNHPEEVLHPNPPVTSPATSSTPHGKPVSRGSYLDALSGSGDDSVESTRHGRSTSSKHESHSARESGYLSGLAQGTPPSVSSTPTYSTSRRTNPVSGASYLEALSGTGGSDPGDIVESSSEPVASNRERGSNYLSGLDASSSSASQSCSAPGPVQHSGSTSLRSVPPAVSPVAVPVVSPVTPRSKSVYPPAIGGRAGDPNPGGSYLDALVDPGGTLDPASNGLSDGSRPDASSPTAGKSYSSGFGRTSSSSCRRNGTPVPEQSSYSRPLVPPRALSFVTPPIDRRASPPVTSGGSPRGRSLTTQGMVGNSYLDALAHQQGTEPSGVKPFGVGLPPRTRNVSELGTNSQFVSQAYSSPDVSPPAPNSDPYRVDPTVAPPTSADENAPSPPENRFPGQS